MVDKEEREALRGMKKVLRGGRKHLRKMKRERQAANEETRYSDAVGKIVRARKAGLFVEPHHELYAIDALLEGDDLSESERGSLNRRRNNLLGKMSTGS